MWAYSDHLFLPSSWLVVGPVDACSWKKMKETFDGVGGRVGVGVTKVDYWLYSRSITNYTYMLHMQCD